MMSKNQKLFFPILFSIAREYISRTLKSCPNSREAVGAKITATSLSLGGTINKTAFGSKRLLFLLLTEPRVNHKLGCSYISCFLYILIFMQINQDFKSVLAL